ncbi:Hypothetical protein Minf_2083 [Methylacidiphilum infernorum V4]|uniref:Uncharacterized protein n=1 Tax=Methylacidiphilum infernorum (isolate V4) TaxID=481448 RepID=B3DZ45_METI4|nr:Hypothetical protein Minf_2083 [Methylacidiphilum infernorum V4]
MLLKDERKARAQRKSPGEISPFSARFFRTKKGLWDKAVLGYIELPFRLQYLHEERTVFIPFYFLLVLEPPSSPTTGIKWPL